MTMTINGTEGFVFPDNTSQATAATGFGFKNRIINGAMQIDQRNAGASVTITNTAARTYTLDRWSVYGSSASKFSVQQNAGSVTPPTGFTNYLGVTSLSSYSVTSGDIFNLSQAIEGFNIADLGWGSANAQPVTISFWVRSSLTGTFGGSLFNSAQNRSYAFNYTISSANTWEQKSVTIVGDTTGTWLTNNGSGIGVSFSLGMGSSYSGTAGSWSGSLVLSPTGATSVVGTNGATFYITGVQLEKGSTATSFDYRPYGTELALCQRYYETSINAGVSGTLSLSVPSNTVPALCAYGQTYYSVLKRAPATVTVFGNQGGVTRVSNWNSGVDFAANSGRVNGSLLNGFNMWNNSGSTLSTEYFAVIYNYRADAEL